MIGAVATLLGLAALGLTGSVAARRLFGLPPGLTAVLGAVVLAWTWLTLGMLALGLSGWLMRGPVLAWSCLGLIPAALVWFRHAEQPASSPGRSEGWGFTAILALGLTLWTAIVIGVPSLIFPVKVVSDGPIYHLYFAAKWWKAGRIFLIPTPFGESAAPYFPAVGDLWLTWLVVVGGGDRLARIGQAPVLLVAGLSVFATARRLGTGRGPAVIAASCFATVTPLLVFSFEPNVDTIFVAGYLLATYFGLRYLLGDDGPGSLILAALAAGGAWGTKAPGVVFIPPLLGCGVVAVLVKRGSWRGRWRDVLIVCAVPFVMEGYWLARNAALTGNPLYPLHVSALGRTWLAGWYGPDAMPTSGYYLPRGDWRSLIDLLLSVLDPRLAPLWLLAVAGAWSIGRSKSPQRRAGWAFAGLAVLNVALYWVVIPYRTQQRFLLHAIGLAAVPLALMIERSRWLRVVVVAALALHVLTAQGWPWGPRDRDLPWDLNPLLPNAVASPVPFLSDLGSLLGPPRARTVGSPIGLAIGLGALATAAAIAWSVRGSTVRWVVPLAAIVGLATIQGLRIAPSTRESIVDRFPIFPDYLPGWLDLDLRTAHASARIAYAGTNLPYYLMGADFRNDVSYVNIDAHPRWLLHDYHRASTSLGLPSVWPDTRPGWDRARPDFDAWLANLTAARIQILVAARVNPAEGRHNPADGEGFPIERVWADSHPDRFTLVHADRLFRTYVVHDRARKSE